MDDRLVTDPIAAAAGTDGRSRLILPRGAGNGIAAEARHQDNGPAGLASRRRVLRLGLAVGLGGLAVAGGARPAAAAEQPGWHGCSKCGGLFLAGIGGGVCPKGGQHKAGSYPYLLYYDMPPAANRQANWRFCNKCGGLFFAGNGRGVCPKAGRHNGAASANYVLEYHDAGNPPDAGNEQNGWRYCGKCGGLFFAPNGRGVCPKGDRHKGAGSGDYSVDYVV